jgi:hypothetical protein
VEQTAKQVIGSRKEDIEAAAQQGVWNPVRVQEYAKLANGPGDAEGLQKTMRTYLEHGGDPSAILATIMVDDWYTIPRGNSYLKEVRKNIIWHTPISEMPEKLKIYQHLKKYGMDAYLQGNTDGTLEKELLHRGEGAYKVMRKKLLTVLEEAYAGEDHTTFTDNMKDFFSTFKTQTWLQSKNPLRNSAHQEIERHLWQTYLDNRLGGARHHLRAQEISELKTSAQEHNVYDRFKDRFTALEQAATQERAA